MTSEPPCATALPRRSAASSRRTASRVVARLIERARGLAEAPHQGRATDEDDARVIVVPDLHYFIFYTIAGDNVHIVHIRHTSRRRPPGWQRLGPNQS